MSKEVRIDAGRDTLLCEVEDGQGHCDRYVDPDSMIFSTSQAESQDLTPDSTHDIDRIEGDDMSVNPDVMKDKIMLSDLTKSQRDDIEELEKVRSKID